MTYEVRLLPEADRFYTRADRPLARKLARCFINLSADPRHHPNIKPLTGQFAGSYRYRVGDWRVVYDIDDAGKTVRVLLVGHRSRVYE